jgi:hypothetical protein
MSAVAALPVGATGVVSGQLWDATISSYRPAVLQSKGGGKLGAARIGQCYKIM